MNSHLFPAVILAGGLATRLHPLTHTVPKSLIKINDRPFIFYQLHLLRKNNIKRVVLCLGHLGEHIVEFVGDGSRFDLHVTYSFDGQHLLGTAGAIKNALPLLDEAFFVLYGDSYLPCNYLAVQNAFIQSGKSAIMSIHRNNNFWDTSNVEFANGRLIAYDKNARTDRMHYIDYGLGVFKRLAFEKVPFAIEYDLALFYQQLLHQNQLDAYEVNERFYEIGSLPGIQELEKYFRNNNMHFIKQFLAETQNIINHLDIQSIEHAVNLLVKTRNKQGRLFILGVGGSAANASHAVNDFRKIASIEAYTPTDNVSELTARINDEGWSTVFSNWLEVSRLKANDTLLVLSVGGGDIKKNISPNLVSALHYAKKIGCKIIGIVGRDGGYTATVADVCIMIPTSHSENTTPHVEAFQGIIWHLLVSHPKLKKVQTKWESLSTAD